MYFSSYSDQFSKTSNLKFLDLHFLHPRGAHTDHSVIFRYSRTFLQFKSLNIIKDFGSCGMWIMGTWNSQWVISERARRSYETYMSIFRDPKSLAYMRHFSKNWRKVHGRPELAFRRKWGFFVTHGGPNWSFRCLQWKFQAMIAISHRCGKIETKDLGWLLNNVFSPYVNSAWISMEFLGSIFLQGCSLFLSL